MPLPKTRSLGSLITLGEAENLLATAFPQLDRKTLRRKLWGAIGQGELRAVTPPRHSTKFENLERGLFQARDDDDRLTKSERSGDETRLELEAKLADAFDCIHRAEQARDETRRELEGHDAVLRELGDLKRSRLLRLGRIMRRITGRAVPY